MQNGDLALSVRPRWIVVLEGVLAEVMSESRRKPWGRNHTTYHIMWHEVPLKRMVSLKYRYPENALEIVSFLNQEVVDQAARYLTTIQVPYDTLSYYSIGDFCDMLRFNPDVRAVYDSDPENLHRFGQVGVSVVRGSDF
jgi:hypothetical protein